MDKHYDVGIIGGGIAGAFAALRIGENHKKTKTILFELGRAPMKRRRQIQAWLGCFPAGDGKIYPSDLELVLDIADGRKTKSINNWIIKHFKKVNSMKLVKNKMPMASIMSRIKDNNYEFEAYDYYQWKPESIHQLSKMMSEQLEESNITFSFDNEVFSINKKNKKFIITTDKGEFSCNKIILCVGRSGWRWINKVYRDFGILHNDDIALFGIRIEISAQYIKELNKCHCALYQDNVDIGPFNWFGTIIPEDHEDLVISSFRSNERRWKSDKVSFSLIGHRYFNNEGCYQTDRLAKLAFLLSEDRIGKEKIINFMRDRSELSNLSEYNWMKEEIMKLESIIPSIISRGYFHMPDIISTVSEVKVGTNLESEVDGMFIAGESVGLRGILAAGLTGAIAADGACNG